jgi:hypothetical protein
MMREGIKVKCCDRERLLFLCKSSWIVIHTCRRKPSICEKVHRGDIAHRTNMAHKVENTEEHKLQEDARRKRLM